MMQLDLEKENPNKASLITLEFLKFKTPPEGLVAKVPDYLRFIVRFYTFNEKRSQVVQLDMPSDQAEFNPDTSYALRAAKPTKSKQATQSRYGHSYYEDSYKVEMEFLIDAVHRQAEDEHMEFS